MTYGIDNPPNLSRNGNNACSRPSGGWGDIGSDPITQRWCAGPCSQLWQLRPGRCAPRWKTKLRRSAPPRRFLFVFPASWPATSREQNLAVAFLDAAGGHWVNTSTLDVGPWEAATGCQRSTECFSRLRSSLSRDLFGFASFFSERGAHERVQRKED